MTFMPSDGTEDDDVDQGCCADRCTGACGGYGFAFELAARNLRDGTGHWARVDGSCWDDCPVCEIPVTAQCCGTTICGTGIVGMIHSGTSDLARRAKDIVRGNDGTRTFDRDEALKRIVAEDDELLRRLASNDGPVDKS